MRNFGVIVDYSALAPAQRTGNVYSLGVSIHESVLKKRFPSDKGYFHLAQPWVAVESTGNRDHYRCDVSCGFSWGYRVHVWPHDAKGDQVVVAISYRPLWLSVLLFAAIAGLLLPITWVVLGSVHEEGEWAGAFFSLWLIGAFVVGTPLCFFPVPLTWLFGPSKERRGEDMQAIERDIQALLDQLSLKHCGRT